MKRKTRLMISGVFALLFLLLIVLVRNVDVAAIGPEGTSIGLSHINQSVHNLFGVNMVWYKITEVLGMAALLLVAVFAAVGAMQLIRRKSLAKVDREILALGVLYIVVLGLYALFEIAIVNYRTILMPGSTTPEASFPSSHTLLSCTVLGSAAMLLGRYVKDRNLRLVLRWICVLWMLVLIVGRLVSGVHWFTDIVGGVLIGVSLLFAYSAFLGRKGRR